MTGSHLSLLCLVEGESTSFSVEIELTETISRLKDLIKTKQSPKFDDIDTNKLKLWRVSIPVGQNKEHKAISLAEVPSKEELWVVDIVSDVFAEKQPKDTIRIIIQRTPHALKRGHQYELEAPQKLPKINEWVGYTAKDGPVDLPPVLVDLLLNSGQPTPAPRDEFKRKQMMSMWHLLSSDNDRPIRRIVMGPKGVGKSYLALFLAAKAYAEGWLLFYVSDANELAKDTPEAISNQICMRFLTLNKDILTVANFEAMTWSHQTEPQDVLICAASVIFGKLLQQREIKTLLVVDEHGALFEQEPAVPQRHPILNELMQLGSWSESSRGARVILTGTSHVKFAIPWVRSDMWLWEKCVTPLSDTVFDKLLHLDPILSKAAIKGQVKEITYNVPGELVRMAAYVRENMHTAGSQFAAVDPKSVTDCDILSHIRAFRGQRQQAFYLKAYTYVESLGKMRRDLCREGLAALLLPRKEGDPHIENWVFDPWFLDLGLVHRAGTRRLPSGSLLCPAAKDALLHIYNNYHKW
ncbi:hypothetical protein BG004_002913 [Podila humilis]|nr:hypothetical protein BG004_002913 [Podila humilis]